MRVALAALAALAVLATSPPPARAQADTPRLRVATQFLSSIPAPDPRSPSYGSQTDFGGISETLLELDHDLGLAPHLADSPRTAPLEPGCRSCGRAYCP